MNKADKLKNVKLLKSQNFWGKISEYPVSDWQDEVRDGNTRNGYWNWVVAQIEAEDNQSEFQSGDTNFMD